MTLQTAGLTAPLFNPLAMIFTNARGEVVFVGRNFYRLTKGLPDESALGKPLHALLGVDGRSVDQLMQSLSATGFVGHWPLDLKTVTGSLNRIKGAGIAAYDSQQTFIGADVLLTPPMFDPRLNAPVLRHADVLNMYLQQALVEARELKTRTFLQVYVVAQIDTLQVLLARMGGPEICRSLEHVVNETAQKNGIPIVMQRGYLEFLQRPMGLTYGMLLQAVVHYAVNVLGRQLVAQEMRAINQMVDPHLLAFLTQLDLGDLLED
jgi:hypothetical protein